MEFRVLGPLEVREGDVAGDRVAAFALTHPSAEFARHEALDILLTELSKPVGFREGRQYRCRCSRARGLGGSAAWPSPSSISLFGPCWARLFVAGAAWT